MEGKTNFRLSGTGIVEGLKVIDVGYNLKQFDVEADHFRPKNEKSRK